MTNIMNSLIIVFFVIIFLILYRNYEKQEDNFSIKKYLVKDSSLAKTSKPILWIYIPSIPNSRKIKTFGDGHSTNLNQDYLYLTMKSIIKNNDKSFTICIVDNYSFNKIIPGWEYNLNSMAPPISCKLANLAMAKLLYYYGGIIVPVSFLCFKDLIGMYDYGTKDNKVFICENINKSITCSSHEFTTDTTFMGCKKDNQTMLDYIHFSETLIGDSNNPDFLGLYNEWFYQQKCVIINGKRIGTKTKHYKKITIEDLFSETYIPLSKETYGVYIPANEIVERSNYEWFSRLSKKEVLSGNTNVQKYILLSSAGDPPIRQNNWISFWKVPSGFGLYGFKPLGVGNVPSY